MTAPPHSIFYHQWQLCPEMRNLITADTACQLWPASLVISFRLSAFKLSGTGLSLLTILLISSRQYIILNVEITPWSRGWILDVVFFGKYLTRFLLSLRQVDELDSYLAEEVLWAPVAAVGDVSAPLGQTPCRTSAQRSSTSSMRYGWNHNWAGALICSHGWNTLNSGIF